MPHARVIDGTDEELATLLQGGSLAGHKLRLIVDPEFDEDDLSQLPGPPSVSVQSREHLVELLRAGMQGTPEAVTPETWRRLHDRIDNHPNPKQ